MTVKITANEKNSPRQLSSVRGSRGLCVGDVLSPPLTSVSSVSIIGQIGAVNLVFGRIFPKTHGHHPQEHVWLGVNEDFFSVTIVERSLLPVDRDSDRFVRAVSLKFHFLHRLSSFTAFKISSRCRNHEAVSARTLRLLSSAIVLSSVFGVPSTLYNTEGERNFQESYSLEKRKPRDTRGRRSRVAL